MSYTLKIRWTRFAPNDDGQVELADESTLFIPARTVTAHGFIKADKRESDMKHWTEGEDGGYMNYLSCGTHGNGEHKGKQYEDGGRLIQVITPEGNYRWYLATAAWLLGENGDTIERVAP
jgi:hypothetical protein